MTDTRRPGRQPVNHGHGHYRTYLKGCRCADCREAHRTKNARLRATWAQDPSAADRAGHGKAATYSNYGCRCSECCEANTAHVAAYRARNRNKGGAR